MNNRLLCRFPLFLAALIFCGGCATARKKQPATPPKPPSPPVRESYWNGEGVKGAPSITINLTQQRAFFYRDKKLVGESTISTGRKGFETPPGHYKVIQKDPDHVSNLYGDYVDANGEIVKKNVDVTKDPKPEGAEFQGAKMPFFLRFTGGYGMHAGYVPSYRASHGCVRMPRSMAQHFYEAAESGTVVTVVEGAPEPPPKPSKKGPFFGRGENKRGVADVSSSR